MIFTQNLTDPLQVIRSFVNLLRNFSSVIQRDYIIFMALLNELNPPAALFLYGEVMFTFFNAIIIELKNNGR